jgi:hypothetical protein
MDGEQERKESECCEKQQTGVGLSLGESKLYLLASAQTISRCDGDGVKRGE